MLTRTRLPLAIALAAVCGAAGAQPPAPLVHPSLGALRLDPVAGGVRVEAARFDVTVRVAGLGRAGALTAPGAEPWFRVVASGVEHGVTVRARPGGLGPLVARVAFAGLAPSFDGERWLLLDDTGRARAGYRGLTAWDATGRVLPARIAAVDASSLDLVVDDTAAVYPHVVIDPVALGRRGGEQRVGGCPGSSGFGAGLACSTTRWSSAPTSTAATARPARRGGRLRSHR
ncbi:MAG: hypothetical protein U1F43_32545 [Myxococcota bacterium]